MQPIIIETIHQKNKTKSSLLTDLGGATNVAKNIFLAVSFVGGSQMGRNKAFSWPVTGNVYIFFYKRIIAWTYSKTDFELNSKYVRTTVLNHTLSNMHLQGVSMLKRVLTWTQTAQPLWNPVCSSYKQKELPVHLLWCVSSHHILSWLAAYAK